MNIAYSRALEVLRRNRTRYGFTVSSSSQHIGGRDSVIAALAAMMTNDPILVATAGDTLDTLAQFQGAHGEIPLYVDLESGAANFGDLIGAVDPLLWFCIGCARYSLVTGDRRWLQSKSAPIQKALYVAGTWQYNDRGLIYVPFGGIYPQSGYLLTDQVLYALAIQSLTAALDTTQPAIPSTESTEDNTLIEINYWPAAGNVDHPRVYHREAFKKSIEGGERPYFLSNLSPRGYNANDFDGEGNALALLTGMGRPDQVERLIKVAEALANKMSYSIPPAYYPAPIGLYPVIGGLWAAGVAKRDTPDAAKSYAEAVHAMNMKNNGAFAEYVDPVTKQIGGTLEASISAAGSIFAEMALSGVYPFG